MRFGSELVRRKEGRARSPPRRVALPPSRTAPGIELMFSNEEVNEREVGIIFSSLPGHVIVFMLPFLLRPPLSFNTRQTRLRCRLDGRPSPNLRSLSGPDLIFATILQAARRRGRREGEGGRGRSVDGFAMDADGRPSCSFARSFAFSLAPSPRSLTMMPSLSPSFPPSFLP